MPAIKKLFGVQTKDVKNMVESLLEVQTKGVKNMVKGLLETQTKNVKNMVEGLLGAQTEQIEGRFVALSEEYKSGLGAVAEQVASIMVDMTAVKQDIATIKFNLSFAN